MGAVFLVTGGLFLLVLGGELLVRGAVKLAERVGVSSLLIGLTVVGFGTSAPELVASVEAALRGSPGIAIGNIVGSNIANVLLVLGLSALIFPVVVSSAALKRDGTLVVTTAILFAAVGLTWTLDRAVGALFLVGLAAYIVYAWRQERVGADGHTAAFEKAQAFDHVHASGAHKPVASDPRTRLSGIARSLALALGGLVLLLLGGRFLVDGAITLARSLSISETVIGLTVVALGTSLPELVTCIVAAIRRRPDVALGNILGSNIYNTLGIAGVTGLIAPTSIPPEIAGFDSLVVVAISVTLALLARSGWRIDRREGLALVVGYIAYLWATWPA